MKTRFSTYDIVCTVTELQKYVSFRVNNIYDIDHKTYLIRLNNGEERCVLLLESGARLHTTNYEWPKNMAPSGFCMKLRKHLKNKRLESLNQLGIDRVVDLQFGTGEAEYHVFLEMYDKGNIVLTDFQYTILNVLRPHTEGETVKFYVNDIYPLDRARTVATVNSQRIREVLETATVGMQLKKVLLPHLDYGPALLEHCLLEAGFANSTKIGKTFDVNTDFDRIEGALQKAQTLFDEAFVSPCKGYVVQKVEERSGNEDPFISNVEFHPFLFVQHQTSTFKEFDTFNMAVDEFFSTMESQKIEMAGVQQEQAAVKKLENVRRDHSQRLDALKKDQLQDRHKAELIARNAHVVDQAIVAVQSALATQMSWEEVDNLVKKVARNGDAIAQQISSLKLDRNMITMRLVDPYGMEDDEVEDTDEIERIPEMLIDINLDQGAYSNATRYYDLKRYAAQKQQKTVESHQKALKSAEKKTLQTLKQVQITTSIKKVRKIYWFEKFFWFISSENYLVIGGRDQQQNELIAKRYMKSSDVYVHADVHGASSIVIKNPTGQAVPPKTLNEAGTMAICYSVAWEAKVVTNAYWVWGNQVTKTAPTGEYLTTGSFMIRGTKNFLPTSVLVCGFTFLFKFDEANLERHRNERSVFLCEDDSNTPLESTANATPLEMDEEITVKSEEDDDDISDLEEHNSTFPDTQIVFQHFRSDKVQLEVVSEATSDNEHNEAVDDNEVNIVYLGNDKPVQVPLTKPPKKTVKLTQTSAAPKEMNCNSVEEINVNVPNASVANTIQLKRGQKSKLKKIQKKYKDQDDEERTLRMQILQSAGPAKPKKKDKKSKYKKKPTEDTSKRAAMAQMKPKNHKIDEDIGDVEEPTVQAELDMIDFLTGVPHAEDELLFAVPVVAPYTSLVNYKFKVKMTPGTGKRGKAAKTALNVFLHEKTITPREKDLLKSVKDDQLARNLPGKVKLSAPRLYASKK